MEPAIAPLRSNIGPYQLLAKIGEGGMGTVYLAKLDGPAGFAKLAVVKELRADMAREPDFMEMFLNEARLAARLTHPHVVHTYGASEDAGRLFIAMEYLDGQPWVRIRHRLWSNRSLPLSLHLHVLADTLAGLHYAHELRNFDGTPLKVVHCDVSPQNVFVTYDGQVKIVDFGVARAVTSTSRENQELFVGKLSYAAPEQVMRRPLDRRADVFAVGVMLWEALTGRRFVEGFDKAEIVQRRIAGSEPRVRQVVPSVPRALSDMCDRALSLDPGDRYSTAADFRSAILDYLNETSQRTEDGQLGKLVGAAFRDERTRVHRLIEESLARPAGSQPAPVADLGLGTESPEDTLRADLSEFVSVSRIADDDKLAEASVVAAVRPASGNRSTWFAVAAGLAAVGVLAGVYLARPEAPTATAGAEQAPPVTPQPTTDTAAVTAAQAEDVDEAAAEDELVGRTVHLKLSAKPYDTAVITVDGEPLPENPYEVDMPFSKELHRVAASGEGLDGQEVRILLDRDRAVAFELEPEGSSAEGSRDDRGNWSWRKRERERRQRERAEEPAAATESPAASADKPAETPATAPAKAAKSGLPPVDADEPEAREIFEEDPY